MLHLVNFDIVMPNRSVETLGLSNMYLKQAFGQREEALRKRGDSATDLEETLESRVWRETQRGDIFQGAEGQSHELGGR